MLLLTSLWSSLTVSEHGWHVNCTTSPVIFGHTYNVRNVGVYHILRHCARYKSVYYHYYYYYCNTFSDLRLNECYYSLCALS